jgi:transcriptional regulator with XRE-family HTH domain
MSLVENGHREPSLSFLRKFANELDAPLGYLLWLALDEDHSQEATKVKEGMNNLLPLLVKRVRDGYKGNRK